jgi:hypothetical protein
MFRRLFRNWFALWRKLLKMTRPEPEMTCGILIIGSLLWDERRKAWRDERLEQDSADTVVAPIRYGRLSGQQRGHTYTMVFSRGCEAGRAKVRRCSNGRCPLTISSPKRSISGKRKSPTRTLGESQPPGDVWLCFAIPRGKCLQGS